MNNAPDRALHTPNVISVSVKELPSLPIVFADWGVFSNWNKSLSASFL